MSQSHFADRFAAAIRKKDSAAIVGIDPVLHRLPAPVRPEVESLPVMAEGLSAFSHGVIDAVAEHVAAVKLNIAFFEPAREWGIAAYYRAIVHAHEQGLLVIGDIKRGDIGSTAERYARAHLADPPQGEAAGVPDAVTVAGYLGENAVRPFIQVAAETGRGVYVLVRPSDPGADRVHEFGTSEERFYQFMGRQVSEWGAAEDLRGEGGWSCVGAVVAPKDVESTAALRAALPHTPFLVPGYGAQGGDPAACAACFREDGTGAIINASRSVIYAFEREDLKDRFGGDWQSCVAQAASELAEHVRRMAAHEPV